MDAKFADRQHALRHTVGRFLFTTRPALYVAIIIGAALAAYGYKQRTEGLFSCQASGYSVDRYLAYCQTTGYGEYEHGAFWFGFEPAALDAVKRAQVIFLGNSRMQIALSTAAAATGFASIPASHYLLGFGYGENIVFEDALVHRLELKPAAYVINVDGFFETRETIPSRTIIHDDGTVVRYWVKRLWQLAHEPVCSAVPALCANRYVIFRSRENGTYHVDGVAGFVGEPVSQDDEVEESAVASAVEIGRDFLSRLPVRRECVLFTIVPTVRTKSAMANAIAAGLGVELIAPAMDGLKTFDGSHLDAPSAEHWSSAFVEAAIPRLRKCLASAQSALS